MEVGKMATEPLGPVPFFALPAGNITESAGQGL